MQVSIEATGGLERRMTVEVPEERIEKEVQNRLQQLARTTKLKGFRPGKVPLKVVAQQYGGQVRQEVLEQVIQSSFYEAVQQEKLHPAGNPRIEPQSLEKGKNLAYTAVFEVFPEFEPAPIEGVSLEKTVGEVSDADVDKMFETLRKQRTRWNPVEREAKEGDRVVVDFKGTIEGEEFKGNAGQEVPITLGSKRMIDGFEERLVGVKAGEAHTLDLTFPADYAYKEVAGKPVQFMVTVKSVAEAELPELDEEFAKSFGIQEGGIDGLREEVRKTMQRELRQTLKAKVKQQVMDKLLEINSIEVPKALVDSEAKVLADQMRQNMHVPQGKKGVDLDPAMFEEQARRRVSLGLLLSEIIKRNELKADADKVRETIEELAAGYEHPEEVVKWYYGDRRRLSEVESLVLEDQVVDWALSHAQVDEKQVSFDEVMNRGQ